MNENFHLDIDIPAAAEEEEHDNGKKKKERERKKTVKSSSSRFLRQMFRSAKKKNFGVGLFFAETLVGHRSGRTEIHQMIMSSRGLKMIHLFRRRNEKSGLGDRIFQPWAGYFGATDNQNLIFFEYNKKHWTQKYATDLFPKF